MHLGCNDSGPINSFDVSDISMDFDHWDEESVPLWTNPLYPMFTLYYYPLSVVHKTVVDRWVVGDIWIAFFHAASWQKWYDFLTRSRIRDHETWSRYQSFLSLAIVIIADVTASNRIYTLYQYVPSIFDTRQSIKTSPGIDISSQRIQCFFFRLRTDSFIQSTPPKYSSGLSKGRIIRHWIRS